MSYYITEDICRCFGRLERNGIKAQLVTTITYLSPRFLVVALKMYMENI